MPAYKNRHGWLIAFGIVELLIACFFLFNVLMACLMAFMIPNLPKPPGQPAMPVAPGWIFFFVAAFYGIFAAVFAAAGIGSMQARNWARILMIVLSSIWLAFGVIGTLGFALVVPFVLRQQEAILSQDPAMQQAQLPPNFMTGVMVFMIVFQVLTMIVLPLILLIFYTRKSVKATCEARRAPLSPAAPGTFAPSMAAVSPPGGVSAPPVAASAAKGIPAPIIVLVILFAIGALSGLATALVFPVTILFGVVIQGVEARLILLTLTVAYAFCAWSFYKLRIAGWWTAAAFSVFFVLSGLVSVIRMNPATFFSLYDDMYRRMGIDPEQVKMFMPDPHVITVFQGMGWLIAAAFCAFVLYTRRYFPVSSTPQ
jgi:hypothetical protein